MNQAMRRVGIEPTTYTNNTKDGQPDSTASAESLTAERGAKRARTLPRNATETQSGAERTGASWHVQRLPFLPVRTCPCGRYALVGRRQVCDECKAERMRARSQRVRDAQMRARGLVVVFSKYTEGGMFLCQAVTDKGAQCQHSRPHGSPVCVVHRGDGQ